MSSMKHLRAYSPNRRIVFTAFKDVIHYGRASDIQNGAPAEL